MRRGRAFKLFRARIAVWAAAPALGSALSFAAPAAAEDAISLIAFGDSLVAGYAAPNDRSFESQTDGFVPQLQAWLEARGIGDVTVVNAGLSGDTTTGGLSRLDWSVGPDADAVLLELGANDTLRGVDPAQARANLDEILRRLTERGLPVLLTGMPSLGNWGEEYAAAFEAMYPELAEKYDVALYDSFLDGVEFHPRHMQIDGLHPNREGVAIIVENIGPAIIELIDEARRGRSG